MRKSPPLSFQLSASRCTGSVPAKRPPALIRIKDATFYRDHPSSVPDQNANPPLFPRLNFTVASSLVRPEHWCIVGPSSSGKTTFLEILRGRHICLPPRARSFPYLESDHVKRTGRPLQQRGEALQYVGFGHDRASARPTGAYLSARYESRREETDFSLLDYLKGHTELNAVDEGVPADDVYLEKVVEDLKLRELLDLPVARLSNGQIRRATIARALLDRPEVLFLDEPFAGLDPLTVQTLPHLLRRLMTANSLRLVLALRPQDPLPKWITHLVYLGPNMTVLDHGRKDHVLERLRPAPRTSRHRKADKTSLSTSSAQPGEPLVEMEGVVVRYGDRTVLGGWKSPSDTGPREGFWWTVRRGDRWAIFGPNGSGKTTILSLICSDHPQSYSLPILFFGQSRLPTPGQRGISIFDIQSRIGHSSPEIHAFFPRDLSVRHAIESAWADTFRGKPALTHHRDRLVDEALAWFEPELNPSYAAPSPRQRRSVNIQLPLDAHAYADRLSFAQVPHSAQRVLLFLRALLKSPDLVILDEAFSGMDDRLREKCLSYLEHGVSLPPPVPGDTPSQARIRLDRLERKRNTAGTGCLFRGLTAEQALVVVSHVREEVPRCVREWVCLPQTNEGQELRVGRLDGALETPGVWEGIWDLSEPGGGGID